MRVISHSLSLLAGHSIDQPERISDCLEVFRDHNIPVENSSRSATFSELSRAHSKRYISQLKTFSEGGQTAHLDPELIVGPDSFRAACQSAGAVLAATDLALSGENCWVLSRPGSHHAGPDYALGFCIFNNLAVGALDSLARGCQKVAILDFDAHHGNGTEDIILGHDGLLALSLHQYPFFPGTGAKSDGNAINLPQRSGTRLSREDLVTIETALRHFDPEIVFVEAGLDAHFLDSTSDLCWNQKDFLALGGLLSRLDCPLVCEVGGGYNSAARKQALDWLLLGAENG